MSSGMDWDYDLIECKMLVKFCIFHAKTFVIFQKNVVKIKISSPVFMGLIFEARWPGPNDFVWYIHVKQRNCT